MVTSLALEHFNISSGGLPRAWDLVCQYLVGTAGGSRAWSFERFDQAVDHPPDSAGQYLDAGTFHPRHQCLPLLAHQHDRQGFQCLELHGRFLGLTGLCHHYYVHQSA